MTKNTSTGVIVFNCKCQMQVPGTPYDTLMSEGVLEMANSNRKHDIFIENSPFDPARNIVIKECPSCGLDFLTIIRVAASETVMFTCTCGYSATNDEYIRKMEKNKGKSEVTPVQE